MADLVRQVDEMAARLQRIEAWLERIDAGLATTDQIGELSRRTEHLRDELAAVRRLDLGGRFHQIEESMDERVAMLQYLGDEWARTINPVLKAQNLSDVNRAVDHLTRRLQIGFALVAASYVVVILLVVVVA